MTQELLPFVATWVITNRTGSLEDRIREAVADLPHLAGESGCRIDGQPAFRVIQAPGTPQVLVAVAPAVRLRPARQTVATKRRRRTTQPK